MKQVKAPFILALAAAMLGGCGTLGIGNNEFSCKGLPEGTRCMSAREVYAATEHTDRVTNASIAAGKNAPQGDGTNSSGATPPAAIAGSSARTDLVPAIDRPVPIRTQAKVMRIWIAPWEDKDADLHASEFVYTEVVNRKWNIGDMQIMTGSALSPLTSGGDSKVTVKSPLSVNKQ